MRRAAAALLLAVACTSGSPAPSPTAAPATSATAAPLPEHARRMREIASRTESRCPCRVALRLSAIGGDGKQRELEVKGVWDAAASSGTFEVAWTFAEPHQPRLALRIVNGVLYVSPAARYGLGAGEWARLDFGNPPATPAYDTAFAMLAAADPAVSLAVLEGAAGGLETVRTVWSGYTDLGAVVAAAGAPATERVLLLMPEGGPYFDVDTDLKMLQSVRWTANGAVLHVALDDVVTGARAKPVTAPAGATPVDPFRLDSLTAKRFGTV